MRNRNERGAGAWSCSRHGMKLPAGQISMTGGHGRFHAVGITGLLRDMYVCDIAALSMLYSHVPTAKAYSSWGLRLAVE